MTGFTKTPQSGQHPVSPYNAIMELRVRSIDPILHIQWLLEITFKRFLALLAYKMGLASSCISEGLQIRLPKLTRKVKSNIYSTYSYSGYTVERDLSRSNMKICKHALPDYLSLKMISTQLCLAITTYRLRQALDYLNHNPVLTRTITLNKLLISWVQTIT